MNVVNHKVLLERKMFQNTNIGLRNDLLLINL